MPFREKQNETTTTTKQQQQQQQQQNPQLSIHLGLLQARSDMLLLCTPIYRQAESRKTFLST